MTLSITRPSIDEYFLTIAKVVATRSTCLRRQIGAVVVKDKRILSIGYLYCTHQPCILCAKMLINAHIKRVVFEKSYPDTDALKFFKEVGVEIKIW